MTHYRLILPFLFLSSSLFAYDCYQQYVQCVDSGAFIAQCDASLRTCNGQNASQDSALCSPMDAAAICGTLATTTDPETVGNYRRSAETVIASCHPSADLNSVRQDAQTVLDANGNDASVQTSLSAPLAELERRLAATSSAETVLACSSAALGRIGAPAAMSSDPSDIDSYHFVHRIRIGDYEYVFAISNTNQQGYWTSINRAVPGSNWNGWSVVPGQTHYNDRDFTATATGSAIHSIAWDPVISQCVGIDANCSAGSCVFTPYYATACPH